MSYKEQLAVIKKELVDRQTVILELPKRFAFKDHNIADFEPVLSFFDWTIKNTPVKIDLSTCISANYQAISLLVIYAWALKDNGCKVSFVESEEEVGASVLWKRMGARGAFPVLSSPKQQFKGHAFKPLLAVRDITDFKKVIKTAESYTDGFNVEYASTLRYVLSELLYNTIEHGCRYGGENLGNDRIPSLCQFTWYKKHNEIHFIIADNGMGVKRHIEQTYPGQESNTEAIKLALKSQRSGTFGIKNPYTEKDNAGMGLYISSNIIRRMNAEMYVVSGNGVVHISPRDITGKTIDASWPGTFVLVTIKLENNPTFVLTKLMQEFRNAAQLEQNKVQMIEESERYYISVENYFGRYAEDKAAAINFRDEKIIPALGENKNIVIDFDYVISAPHSFLSALLATPIKIMGMKAYKKIKFVNTPPEIRETIDFILEDNTD
ncbi:hypothetical protein HNP12_001259 [Aeromonas hydrophila]|uniref:STAS-like domain-containing protein n=1 Tax=Aeromonas hydrophila TaxID=644 RepID=UPI0021676C8A|nr:DUF4325 domain-containing protein [Aeromonas hydrophila]MCS3767202.1 hypothetical protein [Aeromonas hydrophila]MCS3790501.1 hypothetical protein [Aeromonas hydrophila]